ncbi:unnamed protein product [Owenia fusiformis]|uniref:E2 ubiquitin-conjugating enzyme n=1 Tax=Owenia fusiformis TaxID=6347 RepID=A0A8S4Q6B5_OWEFU|nr:unnamed protein product [Owenia fusiformis]
MSKNKTVLLYYYLFVNKASTYARKCSIHGKTDIYQNQFLVYFRVSYLFSLPDGTLSDVRNNKMAATRRLTKELGDIRKAAMPSFRDIKVDESNILNWQALLTPDQPPYNKGAFRIEINFPAEYPFKPPKITFKTKIYHPNIDEKGQVCLPIISPENWKPATKTDQVIQALVSLVNEPEPEHPLRGDIAEEYTKNKKLYLKSAEDYTKKYSEKRPSD